MSISIRSETLPPRRDEIGPMLDAYYKAGVAQLADLGGPWIDPTGFKEQFWAEIADFLPPTGRFYTARNTDGTLLGYGTLRTIEGNAGELKRLYVSPAARGHRIGMRLIEARIGAAREMGLRTLKADTWKNNAPMLTLYESFGFRRVELFPESATFRLMPEVAPFMAFVQLDLRA
jgi:putative acetyltransferase